MPPQPDPIRLTDAHRAAQSRIATDTVRALLAAFRLLDPDRIDATIDRWLSVAVPIIGRQRATSARLAGNYLSTLRAIELGMTARAFTPVLEDVGIEERVVKSLIVTGPATVKLGHERGLSAAKIFDVAASKMAAAGVRHALDGGRETVYRTVSDDDAVIGYVRVTRGNSCGFCLMLCSRGAVYKDEMTGEMVGMDGRRRFSRTQGDPFHDGCNCQAKPVYRDDDPILERSHELKAQWDESTRGYSGTDALNAFRRSLEASRQLVTA